MHQIQVTAPEGKGEEVAKLALKLGIDEVSVSELFVYGPDEHREQVSIQTDTPTAREFVEALMKAKFFNPKKYSFSSQTLPSLVSAQAPEKLTVPFRLPDTDVFQDLWEQSQITASYLARSAVSSLLLAFGMIQNDLLTMAAAFLFTPFLAQALAVGFGALTREWRLAIQGAKAIGVSTLIALFAGVLVAAMMRAPMQYDNFQSILVNFLISLVVGIVAVLATGDHVGRRELIALTAAAQFAIYPAWFGIMLVLGLPDASVIAQRWLTFFVNLFTMLGVSIATYFVMQYRAEVLKKYSAKATKKS